MQNQVKDWKDSEMVQCSKDLFYKEMRVSVFFYAKFCYNKDEG